MYVLHAITYTVRCKIMYNDFRIRLTGLKSPPWNKTISFFYAFYFVVVALLFYCLLDIFVYKFLYFFIIIYYLKLLFFIITIKSCLRWLQFFNYSTCVFFMCLISKCTTTLTFKWFFNNGSKKAKMYYICILSY